jgi:hypothetical protein
MQEIKLIVWQKKNNPIQGSIKSTGEIVQKRYYYQKNTTLERIKKYTNT